MKSQGADAFASEWAALREADLKLQAAHDREWERQRREKREAEELKKLAAEAEAKAAKEAKRNRPIIVKRFKVG
jgi:hypothetical protein